MIKYSVIVPIYNEEEVIDHSYKELKTTMDKTNEEYEIIFVNDGSKDKSLEILKNLCKLDDRLRIISFSRNFGHQKAITAGMDYSSGEAVIVIDADLQDPPEVMLEMIEKWKQGYHVVYGKRTKRRGETLFKKLSASLYYRLLKTLTTTEIPVDAGDFRLIDRKVCDVMKNEIKEKNRYVRGLVAWVGFNQTYVEYIRDERFAGETKYPLKKMIKLALDGIAAFSYTPLKLATKLGFFISFAAFAHLCYVFYQALVLQNTVAGWASTMSAVLFTQGIVLIVLGLMGEYVGRIFEEIKDRPVYIVQEVHGYRDTK